MWIFNSETLSLVSINEIHQNEILGLDFCPIDDFRDKRQSLLVSCSKDHSIKVFDPKEEYAELKHIEEHKSAVVGVKFLNDEHQTGIKLVSADAKGTIISRLIDEEMNFSESSKRELPKAKVFSLTKSENHIILGLDKKVQVTSIKSNNSIVIRKSGLASNSDREYIKLEADSEALYCVACSKKKRDISFFDIKTGNTTLNFTCGEIITALKYSPNYKFLLGTTTMG